MSLTKDIEKLLPHRSPFLFVDEIISADEKGSVSEHVFTDGFFLAEWLLVLPTLPESRLVL